MRTTQPQTKLILGIVLMAGAGTTQKRGEPASRVACNSLRIRRQQAGVSNRRQESFDLAAKISHGGVGT